MYIYIHFYLEGDNMILIIAEKPSVMKNIIDAKLENCNVSRYKGFARGKEFIYTHFIGHLLT